MEVDRRENPREPAAVEVSIYYNSLALLSCKIIDISPDGAFVQMGGETLPMHATIDLSLTVYAHGLSEYLRIPAEVIHIKSEGVGLRLKHPDYQSFSRFVNLLNTLAITEALDAKQIAQA
jgi:hypothetical protein